MSKGFVKSADTSTPVANSRGELERILLRYGCSGFGSASDYDKLTATVTFRVPDSLAPDAPQVPVRLDVRIRDVYWALYGQPRRWSTELRKYVRDDTSTLNPKMLAQAERVAWRHLVLWVDAACSAAAAGMQTMQEAFFAHVLVRADNGQVGRMMDYARTLGSDNAVRRALPAGNGSA